MNRGRILVVTGTGLISEPLIKKLRGVGYRVESTGDGATRQSLAAFSPELILLDFSLLNDSSINLLAGLKRQDSRLIIIVITTDDNFAASEALQELKIDGYITDPYNFRSIRQLIEKVFTARQAATSDPYGENNDSGTHQPKRQPELKTLTKPQIELKSQPERYSEIVLPPEGVALEKLEKKLIEEALIRFSGNQTKAARCLGMSRDTIRYRMKKFGLKSR
jgi:DNA-binding NtrC family response regulator